MYEQLSGTLPVKLWETFIVDSLIVANISGMANQEVLEYIASSDVFELDERPGHYSMGHIITPPEAIPALGNGMMEAFVPVKLK